MSNTSSKQAWKPIVAGVDDSPEGIHAANLALTVAGAAGVACHLVHGAPSAWAAASAPELPLDVEALNEAVVSAARSRLLDALEPVVTVDALSNLDVRLGSAAMALKEAVTELGAGLVVLGGKHHPGITRWFGGSTVHNVVRTTDVPVLVAKGDAGGIRRVLVAVDVSYAAAPTIEEARKFADLYRADLEVFHAVEPLPVLATLPVALEDPEYRRLAEAEFHHVADTVLGDYPASRLIAHGEPSEAVTRRVTDWSADLLVVGSHGKGWVNRLLVGSTTERMLNSLPTNLLVVRIPEPEGSTAFRVAERPAAHAFDRDTR